MGAEEFLSNQDWVQVNFPVDQELPEPKGKPISYDPGAPEEAMMHPDLDEDRNDEYDNWSEEEIPENQREEIATKVPTSVRKSVRRMHRGLGHPSRSTFFKMSRIAGATDAAIIYAKAWICPTCAASAPPSRPLVASTRLRPYGFNVCVVMDLKYLKDAEGKNHVVLSMVCADTGCHVAALLKNRKARHVAKKVMRDWIAHYRVPDEIVVDQGGEFEGYFQDLCEQLGIDTRIVGAGAAWQHGIAERHGGLLGPCGGSWCTSMMPKADS